MFDKQIDDDTIQGQATHSATQDTNRGMMEDGNAKATQRRIQRSTDLDSVDGAFAVA